MRIIRIPLSLLFFSFVLPVLADTATLPSATPTPNFDIPVLREAVCKDLPKGKDPKNPYPKAPLPALVRAFIQQEVAKNWPERMAYMRAVDQNQGEPVKAEIRDGNYGPVYRDKVRSGYHVYSLELYGPGIFSDRPSLVIPYDPATKRMGPKFLMSEGAGFGGLWPLFLDGEKEIRIATGWKNGSYNEGRDDYYHLGKDLLFEHIFSLAFSHMGGFEFDEEIVKRTRDELVVRRVETHPDNRDDGNGEPVTETTYRTYQRRGNKPVLVQPKSTVTPEVSKKKSRIRQGVKSGELKKDP